MAKRSKRYDKDAMPCNKPRRIREGEPGHGKKKKVVKGCEDGKESIVTYGDANATIKKSDPKKRKAFRSRHGCDKGKLSKRSAKYWSCKEW